MELLIKGLSSRVKISKFFKNVITIVSSSKCDMKCSLTSFILILLFDLNLPKNAQGCWHRKSTWSYDQVCPKGICPTKRQHYLWGCRSETNTTSRFYFSNSINTIFLLFDLWSILSEFFHTYIPQLFLCLLSHPVNIFVFGKVAFEAVYLSTLSLDLF